MPRYGVEHHDPKSERRRQLESRTRQDAIAQFRFHCVSAFRSMEGSLRVRAQAVAAAIRNGEIAPPPLGPGQTLEDVIPGHMSLSRWDDRAGTIAQIDTLRHKGRSGRPVMAWTPAMTLAMETAAGMGHRLHDVVAAVQQAARDSGAKVPSERTVERAYRKLDPAFKRVAMHGPHAGKAGAVRHGAVAAEIPMAWLSLDHAELPILIRAQGRIDTPAVKPGVVLVTDWQSGAIVGYHLVDPSLRARRSSYVTEDAHAALCGVFYPEFAPDACAAYSGHLPHGIRFDRATMHHAMRGLEAYGIQVPNLPGYTPHRNGKVEATHTLVKRLVDHLVGSTRRWRVVDADAVFTAEKPKRPATAHDAENMKRAEPEHWRLPCLLEDLPTFAEFTEAFDAIVHAINHEPIVGALGEKTSRHHRFHAQLRRDLLRPGRDGWPLLEPIVSRVEPRGIRVHHVGQLATVTTAGTKLALGSTVNVRLHPLWCGAFVECPHGFEFLQPHQDWAKTVSAAELAYEHNRIIKSARERVQAAQDRTMQEQLGPLAAERNRHLEAAEQRGLAPDEPIIAPAAPRSVASPTARPSRRRPSPPSATEAPPSSTASRILALYRSGPPATVGAPRPPSPRQQPLVLSSRRARPNAGAAVLPPVQERA